jgi:hypothetical protein
MFVAIRRALITSLNTADKKKARQASRAFAQV